MTGEVDDIIAISHFFELTCESAPTKSYHNLSSMTLFCKTFQCPSAPSAEAEESDLIRKLWEEELNVLRMSLVCENSGIEVNLREFEGDIEEIPLDNSGGSLGFNNLKDVKVGDFFSLITFSNVWLCALD